jgi:hypothetical protein
MLKNKKVKIYQEIDESKLKMLKLFESTDGNYNELGFAINYTRIPGGLVRLVITPEAIDQLFIPLPASYFNLSL